jgi:5,5'-dehydrodivanillate O-demethylase
MIKKEQLQRRGDRLQMLTECAKGTPMGTLLRRFWQPVARSATVAPGKAVAVKVMGEELTLFRGETGTPFLVGGRCPHRCTVLHTGWIQNDAIRCMYHGWQFAGESGKCTDRPSERQAPAESISIASYPVHEYAGLVFAYMGEVPAPEFDLPRKDVLERLGWRTMSAELIWDCNWFQQVENSLDAVHVSFVHIWGSMSRFGEEIQTAIPELTYSETTAGIRQIATRSKTNVRHSDWTFPNNNHVVEPGPEKSDPWVHTCVWAVPIDEARTMRFFIFAFPDADEAIAQRIVADRAVEFDVINHRDELFGEHRLPLTSSLQLLQAQDYVAIRGQGEIVERADEHLGASDAGIAFLRKIFFRELDAIGDGIPTKTWTRLDESSDLPIQVPEPTFASRAV